MSTSCKIYLLCQIKNLVGSAAADVTDFQRNSLQYYLVETYEQYDGDRYVCHGCTISVSGQHEESQGNIAFVCLDKVENKHVKFCPLTDMSLDEIFSLFKRFEVVIGQGIENVEVDNDDYLDLK